MTDDNVNDDDDLELEPVDPAILRHQQERIKRKAREAEDAVDVNAVFVEQELGDPVDWERVKQFRFTTRHLLMLTAVLAMVMTVFVRLKSCMGLFVSAGVALGAGWWYVLREERRRMQEIAERRKRFSEQLAARRAVEDGKPVPTIEPEKFEQINADWQQANEAEPSFRFAFSMKEALGAFTAAAIVLGCAQIFGFQGAALLLGFIALIGLVVQAMGIELPPLLVLGWWMLLVMYILISMWAAFGPSTA